MLWTAVRQLCLCLCRTSCQPPLCCPRSTSWTSSGPPSPPCSAFYFEGGPDATFALCRCFQSLLVHVQVLWELVLLGEPLVVLAPSPSLSSELVLALVR